MAHKYTPEQVESMVTALLEVQRKKGFYVTMQEAAQVLGYRTTSAASYALNALAALGKVEKIRNHYHVRDIQEPAPRSE